MNERIRELAVKSGIDIRGHLTGFLFVDEKPNVTDLEKFAELIVKECANYVDELSIHQQQFKGTLNVGNAIRCRFGVKE